MYDLSKTKLVPEWVTIENGSPKIRIDNIEKKILDQPYGEHPKQKLDIYLPEEKCDSYPTLIVVHGGGFANGDKRDMCFYPGLHALHRGFALVSVNYPLLPENVFPSHISSVKSAIRFLRANSAKYSLDSSHFFLYGDSAGGNIVSMIGVTHRTEFLDEYREAYPGVSCEVQGVAAICPLFNLPRHYGQLKAVDYLPEELHRAMLKESVQILSDYLGVPEEKWAETAELASADRYISSEAPPFYIQHGTCDSIIPCIQSVQFSEQLAEKIGKERVQLELIEGATHSGTEPSFLQEEHVLPILDFFRRTAF